MENRTRIRRYLGRKTCLSFCQCVCVNLKTTSTSTVSFSLIPTFPTSSLSTETGSFRQQRRSSSTLCSVCSNVPLSRLVGIASVAKQFASALCYDLHNPAPTQMIDGTEKSKIPQKFAKRAARYNEFGSKPMGTENLLGFRTRKVFTNAILISFVN